VQQCAGSLVLLTTASLEEIMTRVKVCAVLLVLCSVAFSEDRLPSKLVRVTGTAEVKAVPDRAVIELGVQKESPSAGVAKSSEDVAARKILASLRAGGIDEKDIQTTYLSLRPETRFEKKVHITYFVAEQTLTVTVRDLTKLDALLESLIRAGGNRIDSIHYETGDLRKYRDQARDLAVKAAREKAQALAAALGQEIGKAESIEEVPESRYSSALSNASFQSYAFSDKGAAPSTASGENTISASVLVSFELK
jgi:uncharacterized protein